MKGRMETVVAYFKVLCQDVPAETEGKLEEL
jgi:hypothetical protein